MGWRPVPSSTVLVWWVTLFAVLPLWVTPSEPGDVGGPRGRATERRCWRASCPDHRVAAGDLAGGLYVTSAPWFSFREPVT